MSQSVRAIVVGVDESAASERALDRALLEAEHRELPLRLLHTWSPPVVLGAPPGWVWTDAVPREQLQRHADQVLDQVLAKGLNRRASTAPVTTRGEVRLADPGRELARQSAYAALVVVGGKGHGGVVSGVLGSTTNYVVHHAQCPVMVVPAEGTPADRFHRVVVGIDGSACSRSALLWALDAADRYDCPLIAVRCWALDRVPPLLPLPVAQEQQQAREAAARWVEQELAEVVPPGVGGRVRGVVVRGSATAGLLEQAGPDDLLVVGSRGRGGFTSLLLGSTATQLVEHAGSTVVVVRPGAQLQD